MSPSQMGPVILKASLFPSQAHIFFFLIFHYDFCLFYQSIVDLECLRCTAYIHVYTCTHKYYFSDCFTL